MRALALVLAAMWVALAAGCGDDDSGGAGGGGGSGSDTATLKVGVIPIIDVAPLYLGIDKGFFEKQNLKIQPQLAAGGAAIVPAVMSGDAQIGFSNNVSLFIATSKGLPIKLISEGVGISPTSTAGAGSDVGYCEVLVGRKSPIRKPADLAGKTIAVNTLNNIGDVTIKAALEKHGVNPKRIKFSEIPFPDMLPALDSGRVDAAWECEPFVSQGIGDGARGVLNNYADTDPKLSVASYFTSAQYIEQNEDVVKRFVTALHQSLEYAAAHPDEARQVTLKYAKIPPAAAKKVGLPEWRPSFNRPALEHLASLSQKYGLVEKPVELDAIIQEP